MSSFSQRREARPPLLQTVVAALCIFLVLLVGAAHFLHTHPADAPSEAKCSLCVVAHLSASPAPVVSGLALVAELRTLAPPDPILQLSGPAVRAFYIRPPPAL